MKNKMIIIFLFITECFVFASQQEIAQEHIPGAREENHYYLHVTLSGVSTYSIYRMANSFDLYKNQKGVKRHMLKLTLATGTTMLIGFVKEKFIDSNFGYDDMLANMIGCLIADLIISYDIYILGNTLNLSVTPYFE